MRLPDQFVDHVAANHDVFSRADAIRCGITPRQFRTATANRDFLRFHGVWILAGRPGDLNSLSRAVLLRAGPRARLTGPAALALQGLATRSRPFVVSIPAANHVRLPGVVVLRDAVQEENPVIIRGLELTSRGRALADALRVLPREPAREILYEALRIRWTTPEDLDAFCVELHAHRGLPNLRAHAKFARSGTLAESERLLHNVLAKAGIKGFVFNAEIRTAAGGLIGIGDCVNFKHKVVCEIDGMAWHTDASSFQRDRTRQNSLVNEGWLVLRFTYSDLKNRPAHVAATIAAALRRIAS